MDINTLIEVALIIVKVIVVTMILFNLPIPLTWLERKVAGHIQLRLGPFRVGPHGILQPVADAIKLMFKEDIVPDKADKWLFKLAPLIAMIPAFAVYATIPFGDKITIPIINKEISLYISDMNVGILYVLAIGGISVYGIMLGGWASNSKYALLGGIRSSAQMISYELALTFSCIGVVMIANSLSLLDIIKSQNGAILGFIPNWNIIYQPLGFVIFLIAAMAEINRIPFDLPEDEGTLAAGYHVEYSAMRFSFFMLTEYVAMVTVSVLSVILFFGGWNAPPLLDMLPLPAIFWFIAKVGFFIYFFMWVRFTLPRYRYDQLMTIGWKILLPLSLLNILITGLFLL
ncbi:MAG: NADH-quinone oxidoreductase subunit H [Deltaproteobacteria bacterium RIFCSPLOWO2_12_FULL_43_16]|nr:MAG: NADH-quinone oxidoreductase subunit H [Deltaproteobacteria bacterium GWA2_43_19]OGQ09586.1 MAG: NADH-quinone oxidoreductase subunit H [Deltaproteobacteria bacterium RIFCSPHIGHO2_02_FULL_43_33]OGQ58221.1 MAG: NADH-quinone oxidoreductase subunit H [Deltaproteobacteria bacterium RIFCSPLOWO2_12_FULL_43_16]